MAAPICVTCGTQFPPATHPPDRCPICEDDRQYVPASGQAWVTPEELRAAHRTRMEFLEPGLWGIGTEPSFAIGQRALLLQGSEGNVLWDCISLLDDETRDSVRALGGISAIAISHPHYYSSMVEWARAFDAPIHLHADDRNWVMRPDERIDFWEGETLDLGGGIALHRLGGHFDGGQILHWPQGASGRGAILTGDIVQVVADTRWVSFMYSYPNLIPLPGWKVQKMGERIGRLAFDRIYGAWWNRVVREDARASVARSVDRYLAALDGSLGGGASTA